jgi:hypothetical protein
MDRTNNLTPETTRYQSPEIEDVLLGLNTRAKMDIALIFDELYARTKEEDNTISSANVKGRFVLHLVPKLNEGPQFEGDGSHHQAA